MLYVYSYLDHLYTTWYIEIAEAVSSRPGHHMGSFSRTLYVPDSAPCTCGSSGKWGHTFKYILGFFKWWLHNTEKPHKYLYIVLIM